MSRPKTPAPSPLAGAPGSAITRAIDAMKTTCRLFNLPDGHCLASACRGLEEYEDNVEREVWLESLAAQCEADDKPCGGCQQGSVCDGPNEKADRSGGQ